MKSMWIAFVILGLSAAQAFAEEFDDALVDQDSARFLYFNTSSTATSLTLLGALILLGVIAYLIYAGGLLGGSSYGYYNRNDYFQNGDPYTNGYYEQAQYRSATTGYDFNAMNILSWISMMQDAYDNFDFNDLECQKRLICEVLREPEYFGNFAYKAKTGFHWGGQLASMVTLPDDVRELVDEYMDASDRSGDVQECKEYYQCPYSIKDSIQKNLAGNSL